MRHLLRFSLRFLACILLFTSCQGSKKTSQTAISRKENNSSSTAITSKYATLLGVNVSELSNAQLYTFIDSWMGTPYLYGGKNKEGIDCSGFTEMLYKTVYKKEITGSSRDLFSKCNPVSKDKLQEGDLVFFKIESENVSHVGIYLTNNKFVHATVKKGVMIDDLKEAYYTKYYFKGGRLK
jgi:lipoprotein Spr